MNNRIVAIIPVKKTSERVPNKNFRPFNSNCESLFELTTNKLKKVNQIDHIYISTNKKDLKIKNDSLISILYRDNNFCNNITPWSDVIYNIACSIPENESTIVLWCHATNPLFDLYEEAINKFLSSRVKGFNSLVAVEKLKEFIVDEKGMPWNYMYGIWHKYSQDLPNLYKIVGSLFINKLDDMKKNRYVINSKPFLFEIDAKYAIDIDNEWEFSLAQAMYKLIKEN